MPVKPVSVFWPPRRWLVLILLAVAAGCSKPHAATSGSPPAAPEQPPTVATARPEQKSLRRVIERPADVEAIEETPLFAHIPGYVGKIHVDFGDRVQGPRFDAKGNQVQPGQVLAELSVPEMEEELKQKRALVVQADAEVEQASAAADAAAANVATTKAMIREAEAARTRAQATYERWQAQYLYEKDLVSRKSLDQQSFEITTNQRKAAEATRQEVEAKVHSAEATAKESEAKRDKARADVTAAKAKVQVAKAEEGRLAALLEYSRIRAPFDGVVTSRNYHTGYYLTGTGTKPLFVIARTDIVRVVAMVREADASFVADGAPARVRCQVLKDQEFEGKVTRSSWTLGDKERTLRTAVDLPNPQGKLRPGMYAYVTIFAELPSTFTLPASAVVTQGGESFCYVVRDGKAARTVVKTGEGDGQRVQVLKKLVRPAKGEDKGVWEDFTGKEEVVTTSPGSLADGQAVAVGEKP